MAPERIDPRLNKIVAEGDPDALIGYAMELGQRVADQDLGRTQIRNIYGMVKALQAKRQRDYRELKLLIPKLKYAAARQPKLAPIVDALTDGIQLVGTDADRFKRFADLFEAIVAYHYVASEERKKQRS